MTLAEILRYLTCANLGGFITLAYIVNRTRNQPLGERVWRYGLWVLCLLLIYAQARAAHRQTPVDALTWAFVFSSNAMFIGAIMSRAQQINISQRPEHHPSSEEPEG